MLIFISKLSGAPHEFIYKGNIRYYMYQYINKTFAFLIICKFVQIMLCDHKIIYFLNVAVIDLGCGQLGPVKGQVLGVGPLYCLVGKSISPCFGGDGVGCDQFCASALIRSIMSKGENLHMQVKFLIPK